MSKPKAKHPEDDEVYRRKIVADLQRFPLPENQYFERFSTPLSDIDDDPRVTTHLGQGYVDFSEEYLDAILARACGESEGWFKITHVLSNALFRLHFDQWYTRHGYATKREEGQIQTRRPQLKIIVEACMRANEITSTSALKLLSGPRCVTHQMDALQRTLFQCGTISSSNVNIKLSSRGHLERSGFFLYGSAEHIVVAPEKEQTGVYTDDFRPVAYNYEQYRSGWTMVRVEEEEAVEVKEEKGSFDVKRGHEMRSLEVDGRPAELEDEFEEVANS